MNGHIKTAHIKTALILALPLLMIGTALGGEGLQVKITNDGTQDIVVTVYDMNANPRAILLQNARINGFTSVPVSAIADATGHANLSWTATSTDGTSAKCGHDDTSGLRNDSAVNVHADSSCSELAAGTG
jgi:hypothetical protein